MDRRQIKRYELKAAVKFSWRTDDSDLRGEGNTRDISLGGIFVVSDEQVPLGTAVQLEVSLPSLLSTHPGVCLQATAQVIRVEEKGFAAVADMSFRIQFLRELPDPVCQLAADGNNGYDASGKCAGVEQWNQRSRFSM